MQDELFNHLKRYTDVDEALLREVIAQLDIRTFRKGTVLIQQGDVPEKCYFVLKGLVRQFAVDLDGHENTFNFYTVNQLATVFSAEAENAESKYSLACDEEAILLVGALNNEDDEVFQRYPFLEPLIKKMLEESMAAVVDEHSAFVASSPAQRYQALIEKRPDLVDRVPQHQLASYLGITPESLSRIKRRLLNADEE